MSILGWVQGQWSTLPYPDEDCSGRTIIITGGNSGQFAVIFCYNALFSDW